MELLREIKKKRIIQELETFLNTLRYYKWGYYNCVEFDYIYIDFSTLCIFLNKRLMDYGLDNETLFPIIKKFTRYDKEYENYDILWDTRDI